MVVVGTTANSMPELPEVETIKNTLQELTLNKTIKCVDVLREKTILNDVNYFKENLTNSKIVGFERIGKYIVFHLSNNHVLISHLRMEGKYFLKKENDILGKHDLVVFHFNDNTKLVYNDTRRFGILKLSNKNDYKNESPLNNVGPDPFMMKNAQILIDAFKKKSIPIKTALLDQSIMSGLGNIYVDEVLFDTKINPLTPANLISELQLKNILESSRKILLKAIKAGGTTIKSYHPKEGVSGKFQVNLLVYGKKGKQCVICGTKLEKIFVNGRGTTYCPNCQKQNHDKKVYGLTGPIGSGKTTILNCLKSKNVYVVDCDQLVHDLYKDKLIQKNIKNIIPDLKIVNTEIDRKWLREYLVLNPLKKSKLEKLIHKIIYKICEEKIKSVNKNIVIEAPLLFESNINKLCDKIIYISISKENQIRNLKARKDNVNSSLKLNSSCNNKENMKKATIIVNNDSDVANLLKQIDIIFC